MEGLSCCQHLQQTDAPPLQPCSCLPRPHSRHDAVQTSSATSHLLDAYHRINAGKSRNTERGGAPYRQPPCNFQLFRARSPEPSEAPVASWSSPGVPDLRFLRPDLVPMRPGGIGTRSGPLRTYMGGPWASCEPPWGSRSPLGTSMGIPDDATLGCQRRVVQVGNL